MKTPLGQISHVMRQVHDRDLSVYDPVFLRKTVDVRMDIAGIPDTKTYIELLKDSETEATVFFNSLGICFSEFFRNPLTFAVLEQYVLPALVDVKQKDDQKEIRIWSAGCAAGQEAYSVAMLLEELPAVQEERISYRMFATDKSEEQIQQARIGCYEATALRNVPLKYTEKWFSRQGGNYIVNSRLKAKIEFSLYDLLDGRFTCPPTSIYGEFDLVICSNLLFYYSLENRRIILDKICQCLAPGGYIATGEAERAAVEQMSDLRLLAGLAPVFRKGI